MELEEEKEVEEAEIDEVGFEDNMTLNTGVKEEKDDDGVEMKNGDGEPIPNPDDLYMKKPVRKPDSVKPWYTGDGYWPWEPGEKAKYARGGYLCDSDSDCKEEQICHDRRCKRKRLYKQSCKSISQCGKECDSKGENCIQFQCEGLDGCRYANRSRKRNEKCAFWNECVSANCHKQNFMHPFGKCT